MWNPLIPPFRTLKVPAEKQLSSQWFLFFSPFGTTCQDDCRFRCAGFSKQWNKQPILICCQHLACASLSAGRSVLITILWTPAGREGLSKCLQLCWSGSHSARDWVICPRYSTDLPTAGTEMSRRQWNDRNRQWPGSPHAERWEKKSRFLFWCARPVRYMVMAAAPQSSILHIRAL